jgi:hypothetical protein
MERTQALDAITVANNKLNEQQVSSEMLPGMRSDKNGSRAIRALAQLLSPAVRQATGKWCDAEVAVFVRIALRPRRYFDADNVKKLRAPTTSKGRRIATTGKGRCRETSISSD